MKKKHFILSNLLLCSVIVFGQGKSKQHINILPDEAALSSRVKKIDPDFLKASRLHAKAVGDTLYYRDFQDSIPTGWSIVNNNPNNFQWTWDTIYKNGQYSSPTDIITSTSASNGFLLLPGDFYNTPMSMGVAMNTYVESDSIDLTNNGVQPNGFCNIWVRYQQALQYCCSAANRIVLQVSSDNFITFQEYDATNALPVNATNGTITNTINISTAAAFTPNIKIRFLSEGNTHYYWMIDDFTVIEGPENDLELREPKVEFNTTYTYNPFYTQIPYDLFTPLRISGVNANVGCNTLTNVRLEGAFIHVADPQGNPGLGGIFNTSSPFLTLANFQTDNAVGSIPNFVPTILGEFQVNLLTDSDSLDENPGNETYSQRFTIGDTLLARDDDGYGGGTGPGSYVRNGQPGGQLAGDKFGLLYVIESRTGNGGLSKTPTSITFAVSDDPNNIGVEISPKIWEYDEDSLLGQTGSVAAAFGAEVASSFIPYTINLIDTLITIPLDNGSAVFNDLDSGQYIVGWEVTNTNGGNSFEVYEDASSGQFQPLATCFMDLAHQPGWGWVNANPVIRLNMKNLPRSTGIQETNDSNISMSIVPNPSKGEFNIQFRTDRKSIFLLEIRNNLGQLIHSETISVNRTKSNHFDFSNLKKGIYYVSLQNNLKNIVETVVMH